MTQEYKDGSSAAIPADNLGQRARVDWRKIAFFSSLCFALSVLENTIPHPVPFMRLGLANLPILLSFGVMKRRECTALIFCKIFLQAIVQGTLFSYVFVFSFCGSLASGLCMMAAYYLFGRHVSLLGLCVLGALANNILQLALARVFMFGDSVRYIAPVLLGASFVTSLILGSAALAFSATSVWYKTLAPGSPVPFEGEEDGKPRFNAFNLVLSIAAFAVLIFFANIYTVYTIFFLFGIILSVKQRKINPMPSAFLIFFVTLFSLFDPEGKILFSVGSFYITKDAAIDGLLRGGRLRSFVSVSQFLMLENAAFPTKAGRFFSLCTRYLGRLSQMSFNIRDAKKVAAQDTERTGKMKRLLAVLSQGDVRLCEVWKNEASPAPARRPKRKERGAPREESAENAVPREPGKPSATPASPAPGSAGTTPPSAGDVPTI